MRFGITAEQRAFAEALDDLLTEADVPAVDRAVADGKADSAVALWARLADMGVPALLVPEVYGGIGGTAVDLVVAFERLGCHGVPGPWIETAALAAVVATDGRLLSRIADGSARVSVAAPPWAPYALDCALATDVFLLTATGLAPATPGSACGPSIPRGRRGRWWRPSPRRQWIRSCEAAVWIPRRSRARRCWSARPTRCSPSPSNTSGSGGSSGA
ncbi:acyl-CoA dehydrogenase family protein [Tsukamurella soli]|uniref:acyl-CoA dehydrogenase family protein n=1 Tax=Tsukamurella soli TaxID=644556 RepID=UPI003611C29C